MADAASEVVPAATVVVMRDVPHGPPELLMLERSAAMSFAGGALVFPGGRIDPGDYALAELVGADEHGAQKIAAIRESIEEAGVALGLTPSPDAAMLATIRAALHGGQSLGKVIDEAGVTLDLSALVPFARWLPRGLAHRIFDTHFYLASAPVINDATVDATENTRLFWASAQAVLDDAAAGAVTIIFPTRRNLERLARFASFAEAAADAAAHPVRTITPWQEERDGVTHLCIPDDLGYPVTSEPMSNVRRA